MSPVAVHAGALLSSGVEDGDDDGRGVALGPLLEVAAGDATAHPLIANSNATPASALAER
jgi:hypothetical protein